jgi:hypothetical protein
MSAVGRGPDQVEPDRLPGGGVFLDAPLDGEGVDQTHTSATFAVLLQLPDHRHHIAVVSYGDHDTTPVVSYMQLDRLAGVPDGVGHQLRCQEGGIVGKLGHPECRTRCGHESAGGCGRLFDGWQVPRRVVDDIGEKPRRRNGLSRCRDRPIRSLRLLRAASQQLFSITPWGLSPISNWGLSGSEPLPSTWRHEQHL